MMNHPIRILFVEDDQDMAGTYTECFPQPEFDVRAARNGQEALQILQDSSGPFDVVVSDNQMPEMDGMTLLRKIRQSMPQMKVIIVTGYGDLDQITDAQNLGVVRFINKPVKMADLKQLIRSL
jgi:DNA-binding NtrC family response regulator